MEFVWWLTGVCAMIAACRFVILVFKRLTSKENMLDLIDRASEGMHNAAEKVADNIKERRQEKKKYNKATVEIR